MLLQALQDKLTATSQKVAELETQLSAERERAVSAEEHSRTLSRQLAEQQQDAALLAKKREDSEAELAAQVKVVTVCYQHCTGQVQLNTLVLQMYTPMLQYL